MALRWAVLSSALLLTACASAKPIEIQEVYDRFENQTEISFNQQLIVWKKDVMGLYHSLGLFPFWRTGDDQSQLYVYYNKPATDNVPDWFTDIGTRLYFLIDGNKRWEVQPQPLWRKIERWDYRLGFQLPPQCDSALAVAKTIEMRIGPQEVNLTPAEVTELNQFYSRVHHSGAGSWPVPNSRGEHPKPRSRLRSSAFLGRSPY